MRLSRIHLGKRNVKINEIVKRNQQQAAASNMEEPGEPATRNKISFFLLETKIKKTKTTNNALFHSYVLSSCRKPTPPAYLVDGEECVVSHSRVFESPCLASLGPTPEQTTQRPITRAIEGEYRPKRRAKAIGELKSHATAAALGEPVTILLQFGVVIVLLRWASACTAWLPLRLCCSFRRLCRRLF